MNEKKNLGLYDKSFEHDNCGIGAVVNIKGVKTHITVSNALKIVEQLEHRAGKDAAGETGDGVGILTQVPYSYFKKTIKEFPLPLEGKFGVGMLFMPRDEHLRNRVKKMLETIVIKEGMEFLGWREVPTVPKVLGQKALDAMPSIWQCFIKKPHGINKGIEFDRILYQTRRIFEQSNFDDTYVCSFSSRTIVYKGMFLVGQLRSFFKDLQDDEYKSAIALVHSRFSTNTMPSWQRAHPNRFIVHNGEINTIKGNANNMLCREEIMTTNLLDTNKVYPVVDINGSDSAMLDNTLEFLVMSGMELPRAVMMCIPEPYDNDKSMSQSKKDFYEYNSTLMEPWDGPASILFSDGEVMGAVLDRNGLRPSRYYITRDDYLILSSEVGALDIPAEDIVIKDRLRPGKMLLVDTKAGKLIADDDLKESYAHKQPYGEWLESNLIKLKDMRIPNARVERYQGEQLTKLQKIYGYSYEDVNTYIKKLALNGLQPALESGEIDAIIAGMTADEEREKGIDFTTPYYQSEMVMIVRGDDASKNYTDIQQFSGKTIVGQMSTSYDTVIDQINGVDHATPKQSYPEMLVALQSGEVDGITAELPVAQGILETNQDLAIVRFEQNKGFKVDTAVSIGLKEGSRNSTLFKKVQKCIDNISSEKRNEMMGKYSSSQPKGE